MSAWFPSSRERLDTLAERLAAVESAVAALTKRIEDLAQPALLRELIDRCEASERARRELADQAEHLLGLLADARRQLRAAENG
jgi:hypothetical protein